MQMGLRPSLGGAVSHTIKVSVIRKRNNRDNSEPVAETAICYLPGAISPWSASGSFRRVSQQGADLGGNGSREDCHRIESRVLQAELDL